jgi:hypothetical protein
VPECHAGSAHARLAAGAKALNRAHLEYIDDDLKSIDVELTAEDLREIGDELSKINVEGASLDEGLVSMSED